MLKRSDSRGLSASCRQGPARPLGSARMLLSAGMLSSTIAAAVSLTGCGMTLSDFMEPEDLANERRLRYEETDLSTALLAERMKSIDESFEEPRTPAKVAYSLETCRASISRGNDFGALWRGSRACAWLAKHHPSSFARSDYARLGTKMGREAILRGAQRAETFYYLALCLRARMEQGEFFSDGRFEETESRLKMAKALDPTLDNCGPDRHLGELLLSVVPYPLVNATSQSGSSGVAAALEHLRAARDNCARVGENHLAYARGLAKARRFVEARQEIDQVLASKAPRDYSADHQRWLEEANELLVDLQGK